MVDPSWSAFFEGFPADMVDCDVKDVWSWLGFFFIMFIIILCIFAVSPPTIPIGVTCLSKFAFSFTVLIFTVAFCWGWRLIPGLIVKGWLCASSFIVFLVSTEVSSFLIRIESSSIIKSSKSKRANIDSILCTKSCCCCHTFTSFLIANLSITKFNKI
jgi:hypothetical protein